jgi:hypothetical protein
MFSRWCNETRLCSRLEKPERAGPGRGPPRLRSRRTHDKRKGPKASCRRRQKMVPLRAFAVGLARANKSKGGVKSDEKPRGKFLLEIRQLQ